MNETTFSLNSSASSDYGAIVIGGGFYGARLASMLRAARPPRAARRAGGVAARPCVSPQSGARAQRIPLSAKHPDFAAVAPQLSPVSRRVWRLRACGIHALLRRGARDVEGHGRPVRRILPTHRGAAGAGAGARRQTVRRVADRGRVRGRGVRVRRLGARRADDAGAGGSRRRRAARDRGPVGHLDPQRREGDTRTFERCRRSTGPPVHRSRGLRRAGPELHVFTTQPRTRGIGRRTDSGETRAHGARARRAAASRSAARR